MNKVLIILNSPFYVPFFNSVLSALDTAPIIVFDAGSFLEVIPDKDFKLVLYQLDQPDSRHIKAISYFIRNTFSKSELVFFAGSYVENTLSEISCTCSFLNSKAEKSDYSLTISTGLRQKYRNNTLPIPQDHTAAQIS
ncbi:hypothetical protein DYBT9623_05317 [Dyadobacter sp. CECT 9623]|uniref:Uncharacterized protein n=1 Tax=Dyadobacter linearis TaxID=2823330 RepID=A0ABN7RIE6_9BACT|nr:hypothetical protein [Dyadobacter sp. CECT 9623]CAG5074630.1 hypothetical protein DYBT9623_05317 [Dyadobacter sp. CECT 9623]